MAHAASRGALLALLAVSAACGRPEPGISFETREIDLGRLWAGETLEVVFPFEVHGEPVLLQRMEPDCGCLSPGVRVDGKPLAVRPDAEGGGWDLPPGTVGEIHVRYATAGFRDRKRTGLRLYGSGPGLPAQLVVDSWLDAWFEVTPEPLVFGPVNPAEGAVAELVVRGEEPFRITEVLGGAAPLEVEGLPSAEAAIEQRLRVVLPADAEAQGRHAAFLNLGTDNGRSFRIGTSWEWAGRIWLDPWPRMVLLDLDPQARTFAAVQVAATRGSLEAPEAVLEGVEGAEVEVVETVPGSRYQVKLTLPAGLPVGTLRAQLKLTLRLTEEGGTEVLLRELPILGVVQESD